MEVVYDITGRTFDELTKLARLPYKPPDITQLRFEEAQELCDYCYANINDLVRHEY